VRGHNPTRRRTLLVVRRLPKINFSNHFFFLYSFPSFQRIEFYKRINEAVDYKEKALVYCIATIEFVNKHKN
ncbi:MAG: hypothetical protein QXJ76_08165, partial [Candidatus Bathyarchaeia archaeon]